MATAPCKVVGSYFGRVPFASLYAPVPNITTNEKIKKYVGRAKAAPASFTPRRFPKVKIAITARVITTLYGCRELNVERIASMPADDWIATVTV